MIAVSKAFGTAFFWQPLAKSCKIWYTGIILRAIANRNNDLQSAVFDGGQRYAPQSAPFIHPLPKPLCGFGGLR